MDTYDARITYTWQGKRHETAQFCVQAGSLDGAALKAEEAWLATMLPGVVVNEVRVKGHKY